MIFQETWQRVLDGTKTQTRRLVKEHEKWVDWRAAVVNFSRGIDAAATYELRKTYAVCPGRGKKAIARIGGVSGAAGCYTAHAAGRRILRIANVAL